MLCVYVCRCGFCNVWVCVSVGFVMCGVCTCGFCIVRVCVCVGVGVVDGRCTLYGFVSL